jgi:hypothetical protein
VPLACKVRYKDKFEREWVSLRIDYDFPHAAAVAYVEAHPELYGNEGAKRDLLDWIDERKGKREEQARVIWRNKP